jgi:hypothetical protein
MTTTKAARHEATPLPRPTVKVERGGDLLLARADVQQHNAALARRLQTQGAVRPQVGFFRCAWPVTRRQYEGVRKAAVAKWLRYMEQTGWRLVSEVLDFPAKRRTAMATNGHWYGVPLLDEVEIPVAAYFKKLDLQVQRVEVPVADDDED